MEYRLLGPLEVRGSDERLLPLARPMVRALLAMLLLSANRVVSREPRHYHGDEIGSHGARVVVVHIVP